MKPAQTQLKVLKGYQASAPAVSKGLPRTCRAAPRQRAQGLQQQNPRFRSEGRDRPPNPTAPSCARGEPRRASRTGPAIPESDSGQPRAPLPCAQGGAAGEGPGRASPEERRPPRPPRPGPARPQGGACGEATPPRPERSGGKAGPRAPPPAASRPRRRPPGAGLPRRALRSRTAGSST